MKRFRPPPLPVESIFAYSCVFDNPEDEDEYAVRSTAGLIASGWVCFLLETERLKDGQD